VKARAPRLYGGHVVIFATRTPHRTNPIGLTVAKIIDVKDNVVYLSGVDLIDKTPILDIKPYVPFCDSLKETKVPNWLEQPKVKSISHENISFTKEAAEQLKQNVKYLKYYKSFDEAKKAIIEVLATDPRPVYM